MTDLTTTYLGMSLRNPLVASASPLSKKLDTVKKLEDAGIAAVVMHSLFEEQITHESRSLNHYLLRGTESFAEALTYFPDLTQYNLAPDTYLEHLRQVKDAVDIPVIGSLNGVSTGGWVEYAAKIESAGADALELNVYYLPTDPKLAGDELESSYIELVESVRARLSIPVAVKLSPFFTALPNFAARVAEAGADALVLFNRFYQPDIDIDAMEVVPDLVLSESHELRLPLRWIAILYGRVPIELAASSGVHSSDDVVKAVMAGASVTMMASHLLVHGVDRPRELLDELATWMADHEYVSVSQMRGSMSQQAVAEPAAFERANYMKVLASPDYNVP